MDSKDSKRSFIILMSLIILILITFIVVGFILFSLREKEIVVEEENGANITLNYSSNNSGLTIENASKKEDKVAIQDLKDGEYFDFSVDVLLDNASKVEYEISIVKSTSNSTISDDDIKIYLEKEKDGTYTKVFGPDKYVALKKKSEFGSKKGSMPLLSVKKTNSNVDNYRLRIWLSDKASVSSGTYSVDVEVNGIAK